MSRKKRIMENLVRVAASSVFLTGHMGFQGSWLSLWLKQWGASVHGYSLAVPSQPSLFELAGIEAILDSHHIGDVRDGQALAETMRTVSPQLVFHLAAQPLVRRSYREPVETWSSNVMGTVNLLEAVRQCPSVRAVVVITTDKCYENREWEWGYRETDALGGYDPYSASKAACELAAASYRKSFLGNMGVRMATVRAGNVIGGGDYAQDRLLANSARAAAAGTRLLVRNPEATRPWQHVLCALHGYLLLAEGLLAGRKELEDAFNFGPLPSDNIPIMRIMEALGRFWPELSWRVEGDATALHEAGLLYLDSSRARHMLEWNPAWPLEKALLRTAEWYRAIQEGSRDAASLSLEQIAEYEDDVVRQRCAQRDGAEERI